MKNTQIARSVAQKWSQSQEAKSALNVIAAGIIMTAVEIIISLWLVVCRSSFYHMATSSKLLATSFNL